MSFAIKMDDKTMAVMKEWKKQQKQDYLILGYNTMQPKQLVFSNKLNEYLQPTKLANGFSIYRRITS